MASLNNNQVQSLLNSAYTQATGSTELTALDLKGFVDAGQSSDIAGSTEAFTKSLINVIIKNWFADTSYRSSFNDPFYEDSERFGGIMQFISVQVPEVKQSRAWTDYQSGVTQVGQYTVYLPVVESQLYGHSVSWSLPITITDMQWNSAFHSEQELSSFVSYIWLCVDNALLQHIEDCSAMNRNNFMAEKLAYSKTEGAKGVHAVNLVEEYAKKTGKSSLTVNEFRTDKQALIFASQQLLLTKDYMRKQSTIFNTAGKVRFTPDDRMVVEVLSDFEEDIVANAQSSTYHDEMVALPGHRSIPAWQNLQSTSFENVSAISVQTGSAGESIEQSGIVALIVDKWAIVHTFVDQYLASQRFDIDRVTCYEYQYTDRYINNLTMNGCVFYLADYTQA